MSQDTIRSCMDRTDSQYEVLAKKVDEDVADQIRQLINDTDVHGVYMVADAKRVYPYGSPGLPRSGLCGHRQHRPVWPGILLRQVPPGPDRPGGHRHDERGNPLPYEYEQYFAAENGQDWS